MSDGTGRMNGAADTTNGAGAPRLILRWPLAIALAALLVILGAGGAYVVTRFAAPHASDSSGRMPTPSPGAPPQRQAPASTPAGASNRPSSEPSNEPSNEPSIKPVNEPSNEPLPDVAITLSDDAIRRAGVVVAPVVTGAGVSTLRLPGIVEPNAYRQIAVTALVGGRIAGVLSELGAHVRQGQPMAQIFSPELAEAQTRYISARAELDAHERELERTSRLVQIGAASRQELERIHAEHTSRKTGVESARARLELLGLSRPAIDRLGPGTAVDARAVVPAPMTGVVTERLANAGLNVDPGTKLFTVVDLSSVWIVADAYERDLSRVRVGADATVTDALPGAPLRGRVDYIDPRISAETRTARVRIEIPNPGAQLRLGMFADVQLVTSDRATTTLIPRSAVQQVGDRAVVYVASREGQGRFLEREVRLGARTGAQVEVLSGVAPGDSVVAEGSFFLRAERERLGLRPPTTPTAGPATTTSPLTSEQPTLLPSPPLPHEMRQADAGVQTARIEVREMTFVPATIALRAGVPARLMFVRTTDKTCATEIAIPSLNIERALPLNEPVEIELTPAKAGDIAFSCGMNMLKGTLVVK